jgi:Flp pilus assembly protein TadD
VTGRREYRLRALVATGAAVLALGAALQWLSSGGSAGPAGSSARDYQAPRPPLERRNSPLGSSEAEIARRFSEGVAMLHTKQYAQAASAFHGVLARAPRMPEAHVNMGYALIGLGRHGMARDFFESAIAIRPSQSNAYYGLAVALEELGDLTGAARAMRAFVRLAPPDDPFLRKANSALWEWTSALPSSPEPDSGQ